MRNGQNNKRMRGRNNNRGKGQNPLTRVYESNGPDVKVRGTAHHVADKYLQLARDAQSSGDPVAAENYYQHAEHYFRLIATAQEQFRQANPYLRPEDQRGDSAGYDDGDDDGMESGVGEPGYGQQREPHHIPEPQHYQQREHQHQNRDHQNRDRDHQRHNRDHQNRDHQNRDHQNRDHQNRDHQHQPREQRFQPRTDQQAYPDRAPQPQPQPEVREEADLSSLPAFVTGGAPQANGAHIPQVNGEESGAPGERFPLHRRRRRRSGPREGQEGERPARTPVAE